MAYLTDTKLDFTFLPLFLHFIYANVTNYIFLRTLLEKSCFDFNRLSSVANFFPTISENCIFMFATKINSFITQVDEECFDQLIELRRDGNDS